MQRLGRQVTAVDTMLPLDSVLPSWGSIWWNLHACTQPDSGCWLQLAAGRIACCSLP